MAEAPPFNLTSSEGFFVCDCYNSPDDVTLRSPTMPVDCHPVQYCTVYVRVQYWYSLYLNSDHYRFASLPPRQSRSTVLIL